MLFSTITPGSGNLGDLSSDLVDLKKEVDRCLRSFPLSSGGNVDANIALNCQLKVDGTLDREKGLPQFEKLTLLEPADNALMFDIARTLVLQWRNTDMGGKPNSSEARTTPRG